MTRTLLLAILPQIALALNPSQPVVRVDDTGAIVQRARELPETYGATVNYRSAAYRWDADGWRQAEIVSVTNITREPIPAPVQAVASNYAQTVDAILGPGAHADPSLSYDEIRIQLSLDPTMDGTTGLRLEIWRDVLADWASRAGGEPAAYAYPYGDTEIVRERVSSEWRVAQ